MDVDPADDQSNAEIKEGLRRVRIFYRETEIYVASLNSFIFSTFPNDQ